MRPQFFFSLATVRRFWRCFCFRSGLVALFLKMSERGDSWCTDSSFSSLLVKLAQVFESAFLDSILDSMFIPVACAHFPTQFLPSSQLCQWSSSGPLPSQQCSPLLWFKRTRDSYNLYCMDGRLLKLKCKYSNILKYWFLTFISC